LRIRKGSTLPIELAVAMRIRLGATLPIELAVAMRIRQGVTLPIFGKLHGGKGRQDQEKRLLYGKIGNPWRYSEIKSKSGIYPYFATRGFFPNRNPVKVGFITRSLILENFNYL